MAALLMQFRWCDNSYFKTKNIDTSLRFYPLGVIIGNILAHEVIKVTHKYMPLEEELVFDFSALRSNRLYATKGLYQDINSILDKDLIKKLKKLKVFLIGCGALGCEISKNLAMMGVGTANSGKINVKYYTVLEKSSTRKLSFFQSKFHKYNK